MAVKTEPSRDLRFWFVGYRSAVAKVADVNGVIQAIRQARQCGIAMNDYGVPRIYFQFDVELSGWSQAELNQIYAGLGSLKT